MLDTATRPVNDIDLEALGQMVERISNDPREALAGFKVTTQWKGQTRSESRVEHATLGGAKIARDFTIAADEPFELLGTDRAPNPQELLLSAINACMVVGYVAQASVRGITLDDCTIETSGELDLRGFLGLDALVPPGYRRLDYVVTLKGEGSREQFEEIHRAVMATSPNYFNLARPIEMHGRLA